MIPNVFISSTILDLHHLRDSIRDTIYELGYNPVSSEYGDVGYLPMLKADESCYYSVRDCQMAVLIVGKRYGNFTPNGLSVTHNEFIAAKGEKIPVFTLVEKEVLSFKSVNDATLSDGKEATFPGMDHPEKTFLLIQEIQSSSFNNGILPFGNTAEARDVIKKQIAHFFSALLRSRFDPLSYGIKDVLSELKTLKHELVKRDTKEPQLFLLVTRYLLDDSVAIFRNFLEKVANSIDNAVPTVIRSHSIDEFVKNCNYAITVSEQMPDSSEYIKAQNLKTIQNFVTNIPDYMSQGKAVETAYFLITRDNNVIMSLTAKTYLDNNFNNLRHLIDQLQS